MRFAVFQSIFILLLCCEVSVASRILFVFPIPSKSHLMVVHGLSTTLVQRGHNVTVVSPFPLSKQIKNHREIKCPLVDIDNMMGSFVKDPNQSKFKSLPIVFKVLTETAEAMFDMQEFQKLKKEKFDLVVVGMFFSNFLLGLGDHFKCPTMILSVNVAITPTNLLVGNPLEVSAVPHIIAFQSGPMDFMQRTKNFLYYGVDLAFTKYMDYLQRKIYEEQFPSDKYISYDDALKNLSMVLLNSHFTQGSVRSYVPAMVEVGGLQIKPTPDPMPTELQKWLDGADQGAIFFSFGTNAKATFLPREKIQLILNIFSRLKQRVVMKWESETLDGKPDNVFIGKWLPQDDILAHKNVRLFISHCGLGGVVESKYHGVPIVAVPIFGDQDANADAVVDEGWAVKVTFATMTEENLRNAITEVLDNPKYKTTVAAISQLYRDRPLNARQTAIYWVEYVIRYRGAPHLQYPAIHLNFWQKTSIDVISLLLAISYIFFKFVVLVTKWGWKKLLQFMNKTDKAKKLN